MICRQTAFDNVYDPQVVYWLGFLYADGFIKTKDFVIGLQLADKDLQQIKNFCYFAGIDTSNIKHNDKTNCSRIVFVNHILYNRLKEIGFTSRKSHEDNSMVWDSIPIEMKRYFLLGVIDGDGSITISNKGMLRFDLVSNNQTFMSKVDTYLRSILKNVKVYNNFSKSYKDYTRINIYGKFAKIFCEWLYTGINFPILERKKEKYLSYSVKNIIGGADGLNNNRTKGVYCIDTDKYYLTQSDAAEYELGSKNKRTCIEAVVTGRYKKSGGKRFRRMTEEQLEDVRNGIIALGYEHKTKVGQPKNDDIRVAHSQYFSQ